MEEPLNSITVNALRKTNSGLLALKKIESLRGELELVRFNKNEEVKKNLELKAEAKLLREALEEIKKFRKDWSGIADELQQIAKKALATTEDK